MEISFNLFPSKKDCRIIMCSVFFQTAIRIFGLDWIMASILSPTIPPSNAFTQILPAKPLVMQPGYSTTNYTWAHLMGSIVCRYNGRCQILDMKKEFFHR